LSVQGLSKGNKPNVENSADHLCCEDRALNVSSVTELFTLIHSETNYRERKTNKKFNYRKQITCQHSCHK